MTKSQILGTFYSTALKGIVVAKLVVLGISFLTSFILALRKVLVAKLVISDILALGVVAVHKLLSNTRYFVFNLVYYSIKSIISSSVSNIRY